MKFKLNKGLSYDSKDVKVTVKNPFFETNDTKLIDMINKTGRFIVIEIGEPIKKPDSVKTDEKEKPVEKMTEKELDDYAAKNSIDLTGLTKKADKLAKIQEVLSRTQFEAASDSESGGEENEVDFDGEV